MTSRQREIRDAFRRLGSSEATALELGVSRQRVDFVLRLLREPRKLSPLDDLVDANLDLIRRARASDTSLVSLGDRLGIGIKALRGHLRRRGIETSRRPKYDAAERAEWERLYLIERKSAYEIARMRRVPRASVGSHITARGIGRDCAEASREGLAAALERKKRGWLRSAV